MQTEAPEAFDVESESDATKRLYGLHESHTATFGRQCLLARRLVERGVRFVQLYANTPDGFAPWDHHSDLASLLPTQCAATDVPIAGLLKDLQIRGLLEETLVIWGGEFGRTPWQEGSAQGRNHHPTGFTMWLAGGGVRGGWPTGRPTSSASTQSRARSTCMTCTRPSCISSVSTTSA
jgi:uncharacterized protein (DUF1501 family)